MKNMLFLDTHIVVWLYENNLQLLSEKALNLIRVSDLYCSPMVYLELEYLFEIKRILKDAQTIYQDLAKNINLQLHLQNLGTVFQCSLNEKWTRDPFDRIIVAHAKSFRAALISKDKKISENYQLTVY